MNAWRALLFPFFAFARLGDGCALCRPPVFIGVVTLRCALDRDQRPVSARRLPRAARHVAPSVYATFGTIHGNRPPPLPLLA
jgi:hypothetical protein